MTEGELDQITHKYMYNERAPQEMTTKELEDFLKDYSPQQGIKNPSFVESPQRNTGFPESSKAYANAMRALQDKLKLLENENSSLKARAKDSEERGLQDREKWQKRLMQELDSANEREKNLTHKLNKLEEELRKNLYTNKNLEEQVQIKETQVRYLENENNRFQEQAILDKENLKLEIDFYNKKINAFNEKEQKFNEEIERLEREKSLLQEELAQEKRVVQSLQAEVNYLRESSDNQRTSLQKNYQTLESELKKQNTEQFTQLKKLRVKHKSLRELTKQQEQQIDYLKKEVESLQNSLKESEQTKLQMLSSRGKKPPSFTNRPPVQKKQQRPVSAKSVTKSPRVKSKSPVPRAFSPKAPKASLSEQISKLEKEIADLNTKYRKTLHSSQEGGSDLSSLREQLSEFASKIENKTQELFNLKKKQQQVLRQQLEK